MKSHIRIPTTQYGYIEFEFEGTPDEAIEEHDRLVKAYNGGFGLEVKDWNECLDRYLTDQTGDSNQWEKMNKDQQKWMIHELQKAFKRIEAKQQ